jgi:hypothetical protein
MRLVKLSASLAALLLFLAAGSVTVRAAPDSPRPVSQEGLDALRQGMLTLDLVKGSNLDSWWKANALALGSRTLARTGNAEAVRATAREALAMIQSQSTTPPPPAFSPGPVYGILAEAFGDLRDAESTRGLVNLSSEELGKLTDPGTRANVYPYLAKLAVDLGDAESARNMLTVSVHDARAMPVGRERVSALALIAVAQTKLGDQTAAAASIEAARAGLAALTQPTDKSLAEAAIGRAEVANGNAPAGRTLARQAAKDYDLGTADQSRSILQAIRTLGMISLAQAEAGDRSAARTTYKAMRHTTEAIANPYERMVAWFSLADTIFQVER